MSNLMAVLETLVRLRPSSAKAPYFKAITVSSTMGPGVKIDPSVGLSLI